MNFDHTNIIRVNIKGQLHVIFFLLSNKSQGKISFGKVVP